MPLGIRPWASVWGVIFSGVRQHKIPHVSSSSKFMKKALQRKEKTEPTGFFAFPRCAGLLFFGRKSEARNKPIENGIEVLRT